ncbi:hypothetical protein JCM30566_03930 [Marinitoga arctica]
MINMKVNPDIVNPLLGYKLDPGEPGLPSSSPASLSIMRVLSQETGNLMAFKKDAAQNGGYVVYSKISLNMEKRGSFLAAIAGKTQVMIIYKNKIDDENNNKVSKNVSKNMYRDRKIEKLKLLIDKLKKIVKFEKDFDIKKELENKIRFLENRLLMLNLGKYVSNQNDEILGMIFTAYF